MLTSDYTTREAKTVDDVLDDWPNYSRRMAQWFIKRYDNPNEASHTYMIWYFNGPWTRTIIHREGVLHNFPKPHQDIVEQSVYYRVPADKYEALIDSMEAC